MVNKMNKSNLRFDFQISHEQKIKSKPKNSSLKFGILGPRRFTSSRRSQFKIQQMAFMLMAVILFFALVAMFYLVIQYRNLHSQAGELEKNKAVLMTGFISGSTEFSCPNEQYCIDTDKLIVLKNNLMYKEFWPVAYIKVRKVSNETEKECNKASYPDCNLYNVYENKKIISSGSPAGSFVALCRQEKLGKYAARVCELGKIIVGYEVK